MIPKRARTKVDNPFRIHKGRHHRRIKGKDAESGFHHALFVLGYSCALFVIVYGTINYTSYDDIIDSFNPALDISARHEVMEDLKLPKLKKIFKAKTNEQREDIKRSRAEFKHLVGKLHQCRLDRDCDRMKGNRLLIRNVIPENRYWCGKIIQGNGGVFIFDHYPEACLRNASHLFSSRPPSISGKDMSPVELYWDYSGAASDSSEESKTVPFDCPIPCRTNGNGNLWNVMPIISVKDTPWEIVATMEGRQETIAQDL